MAEVRVNANLCKGCSLCVPACPKGVMAMEPELLNAKGFHPATPLPEKAADCIGCAFCAMMCPECAIEVYR